VLTPVPSTISLSSPYLALPSLSPVSLSRLSLPSRSVSILAPAYTSTENTNYQFQVVVPKDTSEEDSPLHEALSRFSQFFIAPLFTESATARELNAVDSEHQKNIQSDGWRLNQLQRSCSSPLHPQSKFGTGSKATLWDDAKAAGIDTRAALIEFHSKYYSANLMHLCVLGPHSLDILQDWVVALFSPILNKDIPLPSSSYADIPPLRQEDVRRVFRVVPIKDTRSLELSWLTPSSRAQFRSKPSSYLLHLLGHEGKGSLLSVMKERGLADGLGAYSSSMTDHFEFFEVSIELTKDGLDHIDELIGLVFGFVRLIKKVGVLEWIHNESASLADISFRFKERAEPFSVVQQLSSSMPHYPEAEYMTGPVLCSEYKPEAVHDILACLTPEQVNVTIVGRSFEGLTDRKEPWYQTEYSQAFVSADQLATWSSCDADPALSIPAPNPFIPTDFSLAAEPLPFSDDDLSGPLKVEETDTYDLYYMLDKTFRRPRTSVCVKLESNAAYSSPREAVLTDLFVTLLEDSLVDEISYNAELAGLRYSMHSMSYGVYLAISGYTDKLMVLAKAILDKMASFRVNPNRFEKICDQAERRWANFDLSQPYRHSMYATTQLLESKRWHIKDYLAVIRDGSVTAESVDAFVPVLLRRMFATIFVHGSVTEHWVCIRNVSRQWSPTLRHRMFVC
jgi:insulysin